jgi:hypothetical protein
LRVDVTQATLNYVFLTAPLDAMSVALQIAVALVGTAAPNPHPSSATAAGPAAESSSTTPVDVASTLGSTGIFMLLVAAALVVYVTSLALHPNAKCGRCKGVGRHTGALFKYATRPCNSCKGRGSHPRLGRKLLFKPPN